MKKFLKIICTIALSVLCCVSVVACNPKDEPNGGIEETPPTIEMESEMTMLIGETKTLFLSNAENVEKKWSCNAETIVKFEETEEGAKLTALSIGEAEITVYIGEEIFKCIVYVKNQDYPRLVVTTEDFSMFVGTTKQISVSVWLGGVPVSAQPSISYNVSTDAVTVSSTGIVEAKNVGEAVITISCNYNGTFLKESLKVKVNSISK